MIQADGYIFLKVKFDNTFPNEDCIEDCIEENIEDYLDYDNIEITDVDVYDVRTISREEALADQYYEEMMMGERGEE